MIGNIACQVSTQPPQGNCVTATGGCQKYWDLLHRAGRGTAGTCGGVSQ